MYITSNEARDRLLIIERKFSEGAERNQFRWAQNSIKKVHKPPYYFSGTEKEYELGCRKPNEDPRYCPVCSIQYNRDMCDAGQCDMPCGRC